MKVAIESARAIHFQELSESAGALVNNLRIVQKSAGVLVNDLMIVHESDLNNNCYSEWFIGDFMLGEEEVRDLKPVNHGDYLLEHLRAEFPDYKWPAEWYFLRIKEIEDIIGKLSIIEAKRTFENTVCSVCETWQFTPRRAEISSTEAVNHYLDSLKARSLTDITQKQYASILNRYIIANPQLPTDPEPIEVFLSQFKSDSSIRTHFNELKGFHRFLNERYDIANPMDKMKTPKIKKKIPDSLSKEEVIRLFNQPMSDRDRAALMVMVGCGLRKGECINLKFCDIEEEQLKVSGKTGDRYVPLHRDIRQSLLSLRNGHEDDDPIFWGEHPHQPLKESGFENLVKKAFKQAGITGKKDCPHMLRHTFGRIWHTQGGDLVSCQEIMGHASPEQTKQYVNMSQREIISKNNKFNPLISIPDEGITHDDQSITTLEKGLTQC